MEDAPSFAYTYSSSSSSWSSTTSTSSRTVPAGSYQYRVVVNEKGNWDVSSAVFQDALANNGAYLQYSGYLKVEYFKNGVDNSVSSGSDSSVADALENRTPDKTVYLDIDGMDSFSFSPSDLDSSLGRGAYLLTYYAKPVTGNFSKVVTGNSFTLSGSIIGTGGMEYTLPAMKVTTSTTVTGSTDYTAHKYAWYYDNTETSGNYQYGKLYWVITVDGTKIPKGVQLQDVPGKAPNHTTADSIAGIYFGTTPTDGSSFTDHYAYYSQVEGNSDFTKLDSSYYSWTSNSNSGAGTLTFNQDVSIPDGKTMYIILTTAPNASWGLRENRSFNNTLNERSSSGLSYNTVNTATLSALGGGTNFKEAASIGSYDSESGTWSNVTHLMTGLDPSKKIINPYTTADGTKSLESGTYIDYHLVVNYAGDESGSFRVEDVVPDGLEPVYVRYYWINPSIRTSEKAPTMDEITDLPDGNWTEIGLKDTAIDNNAYTASAYAYYNADEHKVIFDVGNLSKGSLDTNDLQVQVVMRVTDSNALLGQSTTFTNTMNVYRDSGKLVSTSSVNTKVQIPSISKSAGSVSEGKIPFTITVNPQSEDLLEGSDTVTLVDELSGKLTVDPSSIKVTDSSGNEISSNAWNLSLKKNSSTGTTTMSLAIPDSKKLTITYEASINASPGESVSYSNSAYWFGYKDISSSTVTQTVSYDADATFGTAVTPKISLVKADQNNVTKELSGAGFSIYKAVYTDGQWRITGDPLDTQTTGASGSHAGILTFGSGTKLKYNTVYGIVETSAPAGYVKDSTPIFIAMARADNNGAYPTDSTEWNSTADPSGITTYSASDLQQWADQGVTVNYQGSTYTYTAYNEKASLEVDKSFLDKSGTALTTPPDGTFQFGLYNSEGSLVETLTIKYSGGNATYRLSKDGISQAVSTPAFHDLNVGDSYTVYELDADGDPIKNGRILYNKEGNGYVVTYQDGSTSDSLNTVVAQDDTDASVFTVTNKEYTIPATGIASFHNNVYIGIVILMAGLAGIFYLLRRRKNRRQDC